jgi:hypothetical protein
MLLKSPFEPKVHRRGEGEAMGACRDGHQDVIHETWSWRRRDTRKKWYELAPPVPHTRRTMPRRPKRRGSYRSRPGLRACRRSKVHQRCLRPRHFAESLRSSSSIATTFSTRSPRHAAHFPSGLSVRRLARAASSSALRPKMSIALLSPTSTSGKGPTRTKSKPDWWRRLAIGDGGLRALGRRHLRLVSL